MNKIVEELLFFVFQKVVFQRNISEIKIWDIDFKWYYIRSVSSPALNLPLMKKALIIKRHRGQMLNQVSLLIIMRCSASPHLFVMRNGENLSQEAVKFSCHWGEYFCPPKNWIFPNKTNLRHASVLYGKFYDYYCTFRNIYYCFKNYNFLTLT